MPKRQRAEEQNGDETNGTKRQRQDTNTSSAPAKYVSASESLGNNEFLNNLDLPHDDLGHLRQIQTTYKVKLSRWADKGHVYEIKLVWDFNRLWGSFNFTTFFKGTFIVDPGPGVEYVNYQNEIGDNKTYPLVWCGTSSWRPNTIFSSLLTIGEIQFDTGKISGHFDVMFPEDPDPLQFSGQKLQGPPRVYCSLQKIIDDWNEVSMMDYGLSVRTCLPSSPRDSPSPGPEPAEASSPPKEQATQSNNNNKDNAGISSSITGIFPVKSSAIEKEWPDYSDGLSVRFHADAEYNTVWGKFYVGTYEGFIILDGLLDELEHDAPLKFFWRGRQPETGDHLSGEGEVRITRQRRINGVFHGMLAEVDFSGRRQLMPNGISGYDSSYYREGWKEYKYGVYGRA
ncbi:hypothetical protein FQN54_003569 [Arachnomyces sp. PD_36]|nr:hypothetical protein FQN54_003569 [Arachnomyces sp. PD_36]